MSRQLRVGFLTLGMRLAVGAKSTASPRRRRLRRGSSQRPRPPTAAAFTKEQLEQLVAPIALYPDGLLTQIFMAATYPLQIVEASPVHGAEPGPQGRRAQREAEGVRLGRGGQVDLHLPRGAQEDERQPGLDPGPGRRDARPADRAARRGPGHAQQGLRRRQDRVQRSGERHRRAAGPGGAADHRHRVEGPRSRLRPAVRARDDVPGVGIPELLLPGHVSRTTRRAPASGASPPA